MLPTSVTRMGHLATFDSPNHHHQTKNHHTQTCNRATLRSFSVKNSYSIEKRQIPRNFSVKKTNSTVKFCGSIPRQKPKFCGWARNSTARGKLSALLTTASW